MTWSSALLQGALWPAGGLLQAAGLLEDSFLLTDVVAIHREHYGESEPPDVAGYYGLLDCPVDICAGRADGVIAKENVSPRREWKSS